MFAWNGVKTEALYIWGVRHKGERQGGPDLVLHIVYAGHAEVQNLYVKCEEDWNFVEDMLHASEYNRWKSIQQLSIPNI
jgi:hypothetical protein